MCKYSLFAVALIVVAFSSTPALAQRGGAGGKGGGMIGGRPGGGAMGGHAPIGARPILNNHSYPYNRGYGNFYGGGYYGGLLGGGLYGNGLYGSGLYGGGLYDPYYDAPYSGGNAMIDVNRGYYPPQDVLPEQQLMPGVDIAASPARAPASIEIIVPSDNAEIWFNGHKTQQTGRKRVFATPELAPGQIFQYEVRARWTDGGREFDQTHTIDVQAGAVVFHGFFPPKQEGMPPLGRKI